MMKKLLKILFFAVFVKVISWVMLGLNVVNRKGLPLKGPAILAPNHNSHLDTIVLMGLYPLSMIHKVRPVAAADYFFKNRFLKWFSLNIIGIIPLERNSRKRKDELFKGCAEALKNDEILILFPEGSRGEPGEMAKLKKGIFHVAHLSENTAVVPIYMHGLEKSLPKGGKLLVPFNCDVIIGQIRGEEETADDLINQLKIDFDDLSESCLTY